MSLVTTGGVLKAAFRCKCCGHLLPAAHAGERPVPFACLVCHAGVKFEAASMEARDAVIKELLDANRNGDAASFNDASSRLLNLPLKKVFEPENWEVLGSATPDRLKELGLKPGDVEKHRPFKTVLADGKEAYVPLEMSSVPEVLGRDFVRSLADGSATEDSTKGVKKK